MGNAVQENFLCVGGLKVDENRKSDVIFAPKISLIFIASKRDFSFDA